MEQVKQTPDQIRAMIRDLNKRLRTEYPESVNVRGQKAYNDFLEFKKLGKDVVNVGWANSSRAAKIHLNKYDEKFKEGKIKTNPYDGWYVNDTVDIDGDGKKDVVVYNKIKTPRIINGQAMKRSNHPRREAYYDQYPTREERVAYNKRVKAGEEQPYKQKMNKIRVERDENGKVKIMKDKFSPYKLFGQKFFKPIWDMIKNALPKDMPNTDKMKIYREALSKLWTGVKNIAYNSLKIQIPNNAEDAKYIEGKANFKNKLKDMMNQLMVNPNLYFEISMNVLSSSKLFTAYINKNINFIYNHLIHTLYDNEFEEDPKHDKSAPFERGIIKPSFDSGYSLPARKKGKIVHPDTYDRVDPNDVRQAAEDELAEFENQPYGPERDDTYKPSNVFKPRMKTIKIPNPNQQKMEQLNEEEREILVNNIVARKYRINNALKALLDSEAITKSEFDDYIILINDVEGKTDVVGFNEFLIAVLKDLTNIQNMLNNPGEDDVEEEEDIGDNDM